jgi:hypothetical protein
MTITVSNTNLADSFNTWRLNTNLLATIIANNAVTVKGSDGRSGDSVGNAHITGVFSATDLRASAIRAGNTTNAASLLTVRSNLSVNAAAMQVYANTTFHGNVVFNTAGTDRLSFGDTDRWRLTGGTKGQFLRFIGTDQVDFKGLSLRDITDLSSNSAHLILTSANSTFSDNGDSPMLRFIGGATDNDRVDIYLNTAGSAGDGDLTIQLADNVGDSTLRIANRANTTMATISSQGVLSANSVIAGGISLATADDILALAIAVG